MSAGVFPGTDSIPERAEPVKPIASGLAALALVSLAACGETASQIPGMARPVAETVSPGDASFVMQAASGGLAEVELGELALERSSDQGVRNFAQQMISQHSLANEELAELAAEKGLTPPTSLDPGRQAMSDMLGALSGTAFDRHYIIGQIQDHETQLALFQAQTELGDDPDLRAFAARHAPVIQQHAEMARMLIQP